MPFHYSYVLTGPKQNTFYWYDGRGHHKICGVNKWQRRAVQAAEERVYTNHWYAATLFCQVTTKCIVIFARLEIPWAMILRRIWLIACYQNGSLQMKTILGTSKFQSQRLSLCCISQYNLFLFLSLPLPLLFPPLSPDPETLKVMSKGIHCVSFWLGPYYHIPLTHFIW